MAKYIKRPSLLTFCMVFVDLRNALSAFNYRNLLKRDENSIKINEIYSRMSNTRDLVGIFEPKQPQFGKTEKNSNMDYLEYLYLPLYTTWDYVVLASIYYMGLCCTCLYILHGTMLYLPLYTTWDYVVLAFIYYILCCTCLYTTWDYVVLTSIYYMGLCCTCLLYYMGHVVAFLSQNNLSLAKQRRTQTWDYVVLASIYYMGLCCTCLYILHGTMLYLSLYTTWDYVVLAFIYYMALCCTCLYIPLSPGVLVSVDLWDITQNRLLTSTDS